MLHALLRWMVSETAGIDDVDQVLRAQIWSWGYGPQPPLYTWLTKLFLETFGSNVLSLLLLKETLVFCIYALVYATTKKVSRSDICALVALALLEANPSIAWEAHRELTHTVLVSALSAALVFCLVRLSPGRWSTYIWFGICGGLGFLAKYNFAFIWVCLIAAAFCLRVLHPIVLNRKMLVALLIMGVICVPHFWWVYHHPDLAFSSVPKLKMVEAGNWAGIASGLVKWILAILAHVGPMLIISALLLGKAIGRLQPVDPMQKVLWVTLAWITGLVTLEIIGFRVSGMRDRYVQPMLVWLPVLLATLLRERLSTRVVKTLVTLSATGAGIILLVAPGRIFLTEALRKSEVLNTPFAKLHEDLEPQAESVDCLIAENHALAGNLRLWFPDKLVVDPEVGPLFKQRPRTALLIWDAGENGEPPGDVARFAAGFTGKTIRNTSTCEELLKYHHRRTIRLGVASLR